jgi:hypothetical protein
LRVSSADDALNSLANAFANDESAPRSTSPRAPGITRTPSATAAAPLPDVAARALQQMKAKARTSWTGITDEQT